MILSDLHSHSTCSADGHNTVTEMCLKALSVNLKYFCLTEHYDFNPKDAHAGFFNYQTYSRLLKEAQDQCGNRITLLRGIETGEIHRHPEKAEQIKNFDIDVVIGSIHSFGNMFLGDPSLLKKYSAEEVFDAYFRELLSLTQFGGFNIIGHFDFPSRYIDARCTYSPLIESIFREAINKGIVPEINTSPIRKGMSFTLPDETLLGHYRDCGGCYVTTGSDAHRVSEVASDFDTAQRLIEKFGFKQVVFLKKEMQIIG
jgi:histidinol-phosphatase (PHP family)